jgi:cytochrome c-type biogenesis protein CcmH/NrfF
MTERAPEGGGAAKGRMVGFVSLGALLLLVGVAFYSSREPSSPPSRAAQTSSANQEAPGPPTPVQPEITRTPPVTEALPANPSKPSKPSRGSIVTATLEDIALSPKARLLAERLKCVCGCEDILAVCVCKETPGSRDMKKYLQELVDAGKTPAEVESAMVARYGSAVLP